jgi:exonuclease SbcC
MDILEPKSKSEFDSKIINLINKLKFQNYPIEIKGSSSLKSQKYFSDYDLFTNISDKIDSETAYNTFYKILQNVLSDIDIYFTEFKVEDRKKRKYKWFPNETFDKDTFFKIFREVDFSKLDIIVWSNNKFIELSIIYKFSNETLTTDQLISNIYKDIDELKNKEKDYYKILKRYFSIFKIKKNNDMLLYLTEIFNSDLGKLYQKVNNLEAIKIIIENYDDKLSKDRVDLNLSELGETRKTLNKTIKSLKSILSKEAFKIYSNLPFPKRP